MLLYNTAQCLYSYLDWNCDRKNDRRLEGNGKTLFPLERLSSHNACVSFFSFYFLTHHCEVFTLSFFYILEFIMLEKNSKTPTSTHTISTPESQAHALTLEWQLVPCKLKISQHFAILHLLKSYWSSCFPAEGDTAMRHPRLSRIPSTLKL